MISIYKYTLEINDKQELELPHNAVILSVANQHESIVLYAMIDTKEEEKQDAYEIYIHGTGHEISVEERNNAVFLGTVKLLDGKIMFHVFYRKVR